MKDVDAGGQNRESSTTPPPTQKARTQTNKAEKLPNPKLPPSQIANLDIQGI